MKNLIFIKLSFILLFFALEIQGVKYKKKKITNNNNAYAEDKIEATHPYCEHFANSTNKLYLSKSKLQSLNQFILEESEFTKLPDGAKLDYYIRYSLISRGLCYYDEINAKEINKMDKFDITVFNNDGSVKETYKDSIRYDKTVNCYLYYEKYMYEDEESINALKDHRIGLNHLSIYYNAVSNFLNNESLCPYPSEEMKSIADLRPNEDRTNVIIEERRKFLEDIGNLYTRLSNTYFNEYLNEKDVLQYESTLEYDTNNSEIVNCGYPTQNLKNEYCKKTNDGNCCPLIKNQTPFEYKFNMEPFYYGVIVSSAFIIIGSFFSAKIVKEIKMQENIKKSLHQQEKQYQESSNQNLQNAYNEGFDPKLQTFNSNSRNLNGTLRNTGTMKSSNGSTLGMNNGATLRNGGGRYPPNSYNVAEDYNSSDARDISLRRGMIVQLIQKFEGGWVMVKDIQSNRQGYAPEYCLGSRMQ
ncbi:hypothetical protein BCR36DRAFT_409444 [Piromyces finnis]|uniref:SH3 domain-containing protein n=1 Tax=Piromyces finnis TaxID=1754191 RepID=A0A1Y1VJ98_9FUNG|nr:hypothetical protein BCR36DRAFT_409444 [Piromyces finnis]|eukprot:ORX57122.1 hypothetical protein BCR36DRAFT_409444 [Piromyces finnis]